MYARRMIYMSFLHKNQALDYLNVKMTAQPPTLPGNTPRRPCATRAG